jgi:two-component system, NtrC family, sensor kinase
LPGAYGQMTMTRKNTEDFDWKVRVFDSLSLPALILEPDRTILNVNRNFMKKFGVEKDQIIGKKCHDFFYHSDDLCSIDSCPLPGVLTYKEGKTILRQVKTPNGEEKWEDRVFSPILNDDGEVRYIIESIRDVTRIRTLERELCEVRGFLEKVIQSSTSAIVAADRRGKILLMNPTAEELIGYTFDEACERITVKDLYPPGQAREIMKKLRNEQLGGKGRLPCSRTTIVNARGDEIPVDMTAAIIYEGEEEIATMGVFNDLREQVAHEARMRKMMTRIAQAEKMASLGQLAAGVAHEINNPLSGILLYANLLLEGLDEVDSRREDLRFVVEDANRCRDIVKNLLAYSRQTSPNREVLQLNDLVVQSLGLIRDQRLFMRVSVVKELSDETMLIHADRNQLCQVVINLVMNAIDAMDRVGTLTLRTYRDLDDTKVYLEISDTGCGIPVENLSKVFDPFFTTKEPGKGTGLGLSTVYGIVKDNEGNISVKETGKQGTTFIVELPLHQGLSEAQTLDSLIAGPHYPNGGGAHGNDT